MQRKGEPAEEPTAVDAWIRAAIEEAPIAVGLARAGVVVDVNAAYVRLFGCASVADVRGRSLLEQIAPSHRADILSKLAERARGVGGPRRYQTRGLRADGTEFPFDVSTVPVVLPEGPALVAFITDASEREEVLAALRASEERFRILSSATFEGVFLHSGGKVLLANDAAAAMYGYDHPSDLVGIPALELTAPESHAVLQDHIRRESTDVYEGFAQRKDGTRFIAEVRGRTLVHQGRSTRVAIVRDVTEQRRAEAEQRALAERVRHAQKLESLGALAGGVAHDFNNILTVISNAVALAKREAGDAPSGHLDTIAHAAGRAADLCRQMLTYAGKAAIEPEVVDLGALVADISGMLEVSVGKRATLLRELTPGLPMIVGDPTQIRQVVMNLVINASEAIARPQGTVLVSTGSGFFGAEAFARSPAGHPTPGNYVYVEVRDNGVGMDAATIAQIFEPFFTTKFVGRGLGMAAVLGIVRAHEGAVDVESTPGVGTTIRVYFPATAEERRPSLPAPQADLRTRGVVLLVDDEKSVRLSTRLLLEDLGMEVIEAGDGVEGLEAFKAHAARVSVVLLDRTMPRMDGVATMMELRRIAPGVPIILASGYGADGSQPGEAPDALLAKPYTADQLIAALRVTRAVPPGDP